MKKLKLLISLSMLILALAMTVACDQTEIPSDNQIEAFNNCDIGLNTSVADDQIIDLVVENLTRKGYNYTKIIDWDDFPLQEEFLLTFGIDDSFPGSVIAILDQSREVGGGSEQVLYVDIDPAFSTMKALRKIFVKIPHCVLQEIDE